MRSKTEEGVTINARAGTHATIEVGIHITTEAATVTIGKVPRQAMRFRHGTIAAGRAHHPGRVGPGKDGTKTIATLLTIGRRAREAGTGINPTTDTIVATSNGRHPLGPTADRVGIGTATITTTGTTVGMAGGEEVRRLYED